jgi:hypothetical protein
MSAFSNKNSNVPMVTAQAVPVQTIMQHNSSNTVPIFVGQQHQQHQQQPMIIQQQQRTQVEIERTKQFLLSHNWTVGLVNSLIADLKHVHSRFFIVDDSGSMNANDGNRIEVTRSRGPVVVKCSRWTELKAAVDFHAELAYLSQSPSEFRLLNAGAPLTIGKYEDNGEALQLFKGILSGGAAGGTPLCYHINQIANQIKQMEGMLRQNNQRCTVTIFTDGEASDGDVTQALKSLEGLPCWVCIRLCTDEENIVSYWNDVDGHLELAMDVLDDLFGEAEEVYEHNNWLVYGEPLHRFREFGTHRKELDMLDEMPLSTEHLRATLSILFGGKQEDYPHPEADFNDFVRYLENDVMKNQAKVLDPRSKKLSQWIDLKNVAKKYGKGGNCVVM